MSPEPTAELTPKNLVKFTVDAEGGVSGRNKECVVGRGLFLRGGLGTKSSTKSPNTSSSWRRLSTVLAKMSSDGVAVEEADTGCSEISNSSNLCEAGFIPAR